MAILQRPSAAVPAPQQVLHVTPPTAFTGDWWHGRFTAWVDARSWRFWLLCWPLVLVVLAVRGLCSSSWAAWAPLWLVVLTAASAPFPWAGAAWAAAGVVLAGLAWWNPRRVLSRRELATLAAAAGSSVAWLLTRPMMEWPWQVGTLVVGSVAVLAPIALGRRVHDRAAVEAPFPRRWREEVVPELPQLAGFWAQWDEQAGAGVYELARGTASAVVQLDETIEGVLGNVHRGAVTLALDPTLPVRQFRVLVTASPRAEISRVTYLDNLTLDEQGRFVVSSTRDGRPVYGRLVRDGGASHGVITGGTGAGKGSVIRLIGVEAGASPWVWLSALDGKQGAGIPELAGMCDLYTRDVDGWKASICMAHEILQARAARYGESGLSRWRRRDDPLVMTLLDEAAKIARSVPSRWHVMLEEIGAEGRSLGMSLWLASQRGDGQSLVSPLLRSNLLAGGAAFVGMPGDVVARGLAVQDLAQDGSHGYAVDPARLPQQPGWMLVLSKTDPDVPSDPVRVRYLPSRQERDEDGKEAPFGVAEEWWSLRRAAVLHPQDAEIVAKWRAELGLDAAPPASAGPALRALPDLPAVSEVPDGDVEAVTDLGGGLLVSAAPRVPVAAAAAAEVPGRQRILAVLAQAGGPMSRQEIAAAVGLGTRRTGELLGEMRGSEVVALGGGLWELAS